MKNEAIRVLIIGFVVLTLFFILSVSVRLDPPKFRSKEHIEAIKAYALNPSVSNTARLDDEEARLDRHDTILFIPFLSAVLLVDGVVIYFFWNYGKRKDFKNAASVQWARLHERSK